MTSIVSENRLDKAALNQFRSVWQSALARPIHSANCGCSVPSAGFLNAENLELDLLDYVEDKHGLQSNAAWVQARADREAARVGGFAEWLSAIDAGILDDSMYEVVIGDIRASLDSIAAHSAGRLTPAANLQSGWLGGGMRTDDE